MVVLSTDGNLFSDALTPEAQSVLDALLERLPAARLCPACHRPNDETAALVQPALGRIELGGGDAVDAAMFECPECGAVENVPLP